MPHFLVDHGFADLGRVTLCRAPFWADNLCALDLVVPFAYRDRFGGSQALPALGEKGGSVPDSPFELPCPSFTFDPVRIEITSPGMLADSRRFYAVDFVEADRGRSDIYGDTDHLDARKAAVFSADDGALPVLDLAATAPGEIPTGTLP